MPRQTGGLDLSGRVRTKPAPKGSHPATGSEPAFQGCLRVGWVNDIWFRPQARASCPDAIVHLPGQSPRRV